MRTLALLLILTAFGSSQTLRLAAPTAPLTGSPFALSLSSNAPGGTPYLIGLSGGLTPGFDLGVGRVMLADDALLSASLDPTYAATFVGFHGALDAMGTANARIEVPADPALLGLDVHAGAILVDSASPAQALAVSNVLRREVRATPLTFDPQPLDTAILPFARGVFGPVPVSVGVVKDGVVVYEGHFGGASPSTVVPVASASKWLSALLFMQLVDEGLVRLDDPVAMYLPRFSGPLASITLRQCWSHTSGLPEQAPCVSDRTTTLADCASQIARGGLVAPPGAEFRYGSASMQVAGRVMEVVTGTDFETLFSQRIAAPLGLTTIDWQGFGPTTNPHIAGSAQSSFRDYLSILAAVLDGGTGIVSTESIVEMAQDQTGGATIVSAPSTVSGLRYGLGVWQEEIGAGGQTARISSPGAFGTHPWIDFEHGYAALIMVVRTTPFGRQIETTIRPLIEAQIPLEFIQD